MDGINNLWVLLPALPAAIAGIVLFVLWRRERIAREEAGLEADEDRRHGKIFNFVLAVCRQASPALSIEEAEVVWLAVAFLPCLVMLVLGLGPLSLVALPIGTIAFPVWVRAQKNAGTKKFEEQLGQAMPLIASNLRAGSSVSQAIGPVAENMADPIKSEFRRLTSDIRAGTPVAEALDKVADRTGSRDLKLFSTAVDVSQQTGGSLADITDNVGETVRARVEARKTVAAKTSLNKIESRVLAGVPALMLIMLLAISPSHREFYMQPTGWILIGICAVLDLLAMRIMKQMSDIKLD